MTIYRQVNESAITQSEDDIPLSAAPIFGSVTPFDIILEMKKLVAHNDEAATISFEENMITIDGVDDTKIKHVGNYKIRISIGESMVEKKLSIQDLPSAPVMTTLPSKGRGRGRA
jgi:hypothetical protein